MTGWSIRRCCTSTKISAALCGLAPPVVFRAGMALTLKTLFCRGVCRITIANGLPSFRTVHCFSQHAKALYVIKTINSLPSPGRLTNSITGFIACCFPLMISFTSLRILPACGSMMAGNLIISARKMVYLPTAFGLSPKVPMDASTSVFTRTRF